MTEVPSADPHTGKHRIVIHAGFGKCGSSSIHRALYQNIAQLRDNGIHLFDKKLEISSDNKPGGLADVFLKAARKQGEQLTEKVASGIQSVAGQNGAATGVLSAVTLSSRGMPRLFAGLDQLCDLSVVFYARPQWQWIPSAWQQWVLKKGRSLDEFVSQCLEIGRPAFRVHVEEWQKVLPAAKFRVRFLISDLLKGQDPARDFFHLLGLPADTYRFEEEARNTSLDFALLHVLSKNSHLFSGIHDNRVRQGLRQALAKRFQTANIRMLSTEQETKIEEFFRDENLWLLKHYGDEIDVDQAYHAYFIPPKAGQRYSDVGEMDVIYRCLGIMLEALAVRRQQRPAQKRGPRAPQQQNKAARD
jgi:hypothetical protein